jgi:hypothetical protein
MLARARGNATVFFTSGPYTDYYRQVVELIRAKTHQTFRAHAVQTVRAAC